MRPGRRLTREEAAAWAKVAKTVQRMENQSDPPPPGEVAATQWLTEGAPLQRPAHRPGRPLHQPAAGPPPPKGEELKAKPLDRHSLDASWDRKLARGLVPPDFTIDLHGATLDAAHARLDNGLTLALAQGARLVLLITGRPRPSDDRHSRGVIRRKFMDWLAAGPHAGRIAAVRPAHPRHGGAGAVYLVLRRAR